MTTHLTAGLLCQSCGMPLANPADRGTDATGAPSADYCRFCMQGGRFTDSNITAQGMIDRCAGIMADRGIMHAEEARSAMTALIPTLGRWRQPRAGQQQ